MYYIFCKTVLLAANKIFFSLFFHRSSPMSARSSRVANNSDVYPSVSNHSNHRHHRDNEVQFSVSGKALSARSMHSDLSTTTDYRGDSSDSEDNQTQVSKSTSTSVAQSRYRHDSPRTAGQSKRVMAQCKSYINKGGAHAIDYSVKQPVVIKQKATMKVQQEETIHLTPHNKRNKLSVPTQLKAEALWHDNVLRLIVRGPANKLPPLKAASFQNGSTPEIPIDMELTFIPTPPRGPKPPKPATKNTTNTASYTKRRPFVSKPKSKQADLSSYESIDRNIIANRAVGTGFITQVNQKEHLNTLPRVQQGSTNMTTSSVHYAGNHFGRSGINATRSAFNASGYRSLAKY